MLRFFNQLSAITTNHRMSAVTQRTVWQQAVTARPPIRQQDVLDRSVLHTTGQLGFLHVIDRASLHSAGTKISGGRSKGHKLMRIMPDGAREFYYFKLPFYRWGFIKELIAGALARELMGEHEPKVYALELSHDDKTGLAQYGLLSQSLGSNLHYDNLENWAYLYNEDYEEALFGPKHLGCSLAFKLLLGDSDAKAANIVMLRDQQGHCYSIDHEYAFDYAPQFITDADVAVKQLKDFHAGTEEGHFIPLQKEPELLARVFPVFRDAVQCDIESGEVIKLYENFANLSLNRLHRLFNQYGPLVHTEERDCLLKDLLARQEATLKFINTQDSRMLLSRDFN